MLLGGPGLGHMGQQGQQTHFGTYFGQSRGHVYVVQWGWVRWGVCAVFWQGMSACLVVLAVVLVWLLCFGWARVVVVIWFFAAGCWSCVVGYVGVLPVVVGGGVSRQKEPVARCDRCVS